ncbi:MAG: hypothetical protein AUK29_01955 [Nitrospirae bacterium CG2_30_53_67]|nr:MAG: hypothetical protein AUK29_01955 [Nitrospirae bacterium CG2_30_53_67]
MGKIRKPHPVMLFIGMLSSDVVLMDEAVMLLQTAFGPILHQTSDLSWRHTDYYVEELGENIFRRFLFFQDLILPDRIAGIKVETNRIEERYMRRVEGKPLRRINLDPGYLDASRIVLATTKDFSHRIYLAHGIYAEVTLCFVRGSFRPFDHTYPDYRSGETLEIFHRMRERFVQRYKKNGI